MTGQTRMFDRTSETLYWKNEYSIHLSLRLDQSIQYIRNNPKTKTLEHFSSFLSLLETAIQYPQFESKTLKMIQELHPLPIRWGFGYQWEPYLRFAVQHPNNEAEYLLFMNDLAEIQFNNGDFHEAINNCNLVINSVTHHSGQFARTISILIQCHRLLAQHDQANDIYKHWSKEFYLSQPSLDIPKDQIEGWLRLKSCQLFVLREHGEVDQALKLIEALIQANDACFGLDDQLSASLYTQRSTLMWVKARYPQAIYDTKHAISLYCSMDDTFNAESLKSDLGLIYWSMGELDLAEENLTSAIQFYKAIKANQLLTYDLGNLGLVYFSRGDLQHARELTQQQMELAFRIGFMPEYYRGRTNLADILYYFGEYQKNIDEHLSTDKYYVTHGSREGYEVGHLWVACCQYKLGKKEAAVNSLLEILAFCSKYNSRVLEGLTHRCLSLFLAPEERLSHLRRGLELAREQRRQLEESACLLALAQVIQDEQERKETWEKGAAILQKIGASRWLEGHSIANPPFIPLFI